MDEEIGGLGGTNSCRGSGESGMSFAVNERAKGRGATEERRRELTVVVDLSILVARRSSSEICFSFLRDDLREPLVEESLVVVSPSETRELDEGELVRELRGIVNADERS